MLSLKHKWGLFIMVILLLIIYGLVIRPIFIEELKAGGGFLFDTAGLWLPRFQEFANQYGSRLIEIADSWAIRLLFALIVFTFFDKLILLGLQGFIRLNQPVFITRLQIILLSLTISWYQWEMWTELAAQCRMDGLYQGLPLLGIYTLSLPSWENIKLLQIVIISLPVLFLFHFVVQRFTILPTILGIQSLLFLYLQLLFLGFGKIDHTYATLNFTLIAFSFLVINSSASWPVQSAKVWIALAYFLAALEKLTLSPIAWISGDSLLYYSILHETSYTPIIKYHKWLAMLGSWFTILFESGLLISILVGRAYHWIVIGLIGFHIGTWFLMDIGGGVNNPWVMVLLIIFVLPDMITTLSADYRKSA